MLAFVKKKEPQPITRNSLGMDLTILRRVILDLRQDEIKCWQIRMVFVADKIPAELLRIVELLKAQTGPAEVLAVELRQYIGEGVNCYDRLLILALSFYILQISYTENQLIGRS